MSGKNGKTTKDDGDDRVGEAWAALLLLRDKRPDGMSPSTWLAVWAFLHYLGGWARYEMINPEQQTLADDMGITRRAVRTYTEHAEKAGLLKTEPLHNHFGKWNLTRYYLTWIEVAAKLTEAEKPAKSPDPGMDPETHAPSDAERHLEGSSPSDAERHLQVTQNVTSSDACGPPIGSLPSEEKTNTVDPFGINDDDDRARSSSSSSSNPAERGRVLPARGPGPGLTEVPQRPGWYYVTDPASSPWESDRLMAASGLQHTTDADGPQHTCTACGRKHNRFTAKEGCLRCGDEVQPFAGYLDGGEPICANCDLSPAAKRQREEALAQMKVIRAREQHQVREVDAIRLRTEGLSGVSTWPRGYVFPQWHPRSWGWI